MSHLLVQVLSATNIEAGRPGADVNAYIVYIIGHILPASSVVTKPITPNKCLVSIQYGVSRSISVFGSLGRRHH